MPLFTRQKETRVSFRPGEPGLGMDHLIFDVEGGGGGWENPKKNYQASSSSWKKKILQNAGYLEKKWST